MSDKHNLIAFLATLGAVVALYGLGALLTYNGKPMEALGVGAAGTGLIALLGLLVRGGRSATSNVEQANTVNQIPETKE